VGVLETLGISKRGMKTIDTSGFNSTLPFS